MAIWSHPKQTVPPVATTFYSFHIMVFLGVLFPAIFVFYLIAAVKDTIAEKKGCCLWVSSHFSWP